MNVKATVNPSNLDVALSTRASESTLSSILDKFDVVASKFGEAYLYNSTDAKSVYDHLKDIAGKVATEASLTRVQEDVSGSGDWRIKIRNDDKLANLDTSLSSIKSSIESQLPRKLYGYDGTGWVAVKVTSDGKVCCVWG